MYEATCFVCNKQISWQEIQSEDVVCIGKDVAHSDCYYDDMPDNVGGLGLHGPKNNCPID